MATPQIASIEFTSLRGSVAKPARAVINIGDPAQDGISSLQLGIHSEPTTLTTLCDLDSAVLAESHRSACANLQGTIVTITHADGRTDENVLIVRVIPKREAYRVVTAVGGIGTAATRYVQEMQWQVQKVTST